MATVHLVITGHVQGVGFRKFVQYHARKLSITGWVQNIPERRVEGLLQGDKKKLIKLIGICKKGPVIARVAYVQVTWKESEEVCEEFRIIK